MLMEAAGPQGPDAGGGITAAIILWSVVSLIFFTANAGLAIGSIARGRSATEPLIACALPVVCMVLPLVLEPFFGDEIPARGSSFNRRRSSQRNFRRPSLSFFRATAQVRDIDIRRNG